MYRRFQRISGSKVDVPVSVTVDLNRELQEFGQRL